MKRNGRIRSRSRTKHKPSALRPNKWVRLSPAEYDALKLEHWLAQGRRCANDHCQVCIWLPMYGELHHKQFRSHGGPDTFANTELLCQRCWKRKRKL